jgi:hypothetical protein
LKSDNTPPNKCKVCGEIFVVDSLARICEQKHEGVVFKTGVDAYLESLENTKKKKEK